MKKSTKAVLFSVLVFPGTGHFLVEEFQRGFLWLSAAGILLFIYCRYAWNTAQKIVSNVDINAGLDINQLMAQANATTAQSSNGWMTLVGWLLVVIWIVAAVDVYRLAK